MECEFYSIGKVEEICKITKKALRYYDKMGILSPDKIMDENGYRYYSKKNLLSVPMIKYYKQSGFKLEEMKEFLAGAPYTLFENSFRDKIDELKEQEKEIHLKLRSIEDWYGLIREAEMVLKNNVCNVSIKYIDRCQMTFLDQEYNYDYMDSIINIEFTNYIESIKNAITGPVIIQFPSFKDKVEGKCKNIRIMQETILKCDADKSIEYGGEMVISCYHIGSHSTIDETYKKIQDFISEYGYKCDEEVYERYVTDYWTTQDENKFVTEVFVKIKR
ncbi:MerR family transcriptional regulator [Clostridium culturomicium]|uniref:MerR family transcriptional regulator n=1 Tax=Clostridium culturomicium TaxID=1499683 RepID=UPI00058EC87B|nr:MerR family transcriptional regulator [Clostridium culturomicium]